MFLESNGKFPRIETLDDLKSKASHLPEIRFSTHENGFTTVCYMIGNNELWSGGDVAWVRECRGITFDREGKIASRPLHKFFNVGERPETQKGVIDWSSIVRTCDKRDGSMITPVLVDGKVKVKTKKSFESDVAIAAQKYVDDNAFMYMFCLRLLSVGWTPIFEYTSPTSRIVIDYGAKEEMVLLHIRENTSGEYMEEHLLRYLSRHFFIPLVSGYDFNRDQANVQVEYFLNSAESEEGIEGYVFQTGEGEMFKLKTKWYLDLHHRMVFISERDVAEMVLDETLDDYKSYLSGLVDQTSMNRVLEIETKVSHDINMIEAYVGQLVDENKGLSVKDFAIRYGKEELFGLAVTLFRGKEPDYKDWYRKWKLKKTFAPIQV